MTLNRTAILDAPEQVDPIIEQVRAIKALIGALQMQVKALEAALDDAADEAPECMHPASQREYLPGTMGSKRTFDCGVCTARVTED